MVRQSTPRVVEELIATAVLDTWWVTAGVARAAKNDAWHALDERYAAALLPRAGDLAETFARSAGRELGRTHLG